MKKILLTSLLLITITGCTEFAMLMSGSSLAISQSTYAKLYNSVDFLTVITTEKSMKEHTYDSVKKAWTEVKEGKKYIYDTPPSLFGNKH